jgi:hypothetical protein
MTPTRRDNALREQGGVGTNSNSIKSNHSPIDRLLSCLDRVKRTGPSTWVASCPTREDKRPSMTIRELDDGRVLVHDFGGDSVEEILGAIGLTFSDLYPPKPADPESYSKPERRPFPAADTLRAVAFEALLVGCAAAAVSAGEPLATVDRERLMLAVSRIQDALDLAGVRHG